MSFRKAFEAFALKMYFLFYICVVKSISDISEESGTNCQALSMNDTDIIETFGTNSSMLMQFKSVIVNIIRISRDHFLYYIHRYDELRHSYSKCVHKLVKKTNQLKKVLREAEMKNFVNVQLTDKNRQLNEKMEQVCYRFFDLMDRRSEEVRNRFQFLLDISRKTFLFSLFSYQLSIHKSLIEELQLKLMTWNEKIHCQTESNFH